MPREKIDCTMNGPGELYTQMKIYWRTLQNALQPSRSFRDVNYFHFQMCPLRQIILMQTNCWRTAEKFYALLYALDIDLRFLQLITSEFLT